MRYAWLITISLLAMGQLYADAYDPSIARQAWRVVASIERQNEVPRGLLHSMSLVETGQGLDGHVLPWPYTVGVNPTSTYKFGQVSEALTKLDKLRRIGFKRFDVTINGKKQKNLSASAIERLFLKQNEGEISLKGRHFSKRFDSGSIAASYVKNALEQGYDNLDIGLMQINWHYHKDGFAGIEEAFDPAKNASYAVSYLRKHRQERDWWNSVGRYHSGTKKYAQRYIRNVYAMYRRVHRLKSSA